MKWEPTKAPLDDYKTWDMISEGRTDCCFQLDKELGQSYSQKLKPHSIHEWADLISIIRPGTLDAKLGDKKMTDVYIDRKHKYDDVSYLHDGLIPILEPTQGVSVYQEQSMRMATDLANFTASEADKYIRKGIGKKKQDLINHARKMFVDGATKNGYKTVLAEKIFESIEASARYAFCKSHAYTYAYDGYYFSAYPKANFTKEFFCTELTFAKGNQEITEWESIEKIILAGKAIGLYFLPPDVRYLNRDFAILGDEILFGLKKIKNISEACVSKLQKKYPDIHSFSWKQILLDVFDTLTSKQSESLIMSGAFDWVPLSRSKMLHENSVLNITFALTDSERKFLLDFDGSHYDGLQYLLKNPDEKITIKGKQKRVLYNKTSVEKCEKQLFNLEFPCRSNKDSVRKLVQWEQHVLGVPLTFSKTDVFSLTTGDYSCNELNGNYIPNKTQLCVTGVISRVRVYKSFDSDEDMCYFGIEDSTGLFKSICCSASEYKKYKHIINDYVPVVITGALYRNKYGQQKIYVNTLKEA